MQLIEQQIRNSILTKEILLRDKKAMETLSEIIVRVEKCYREGGKILVAGNGGSAADAQHFAGELTGRYKKERKAYPALALSTDTSVLTAIANDYDFDIVFERQLEAFAKRGDIFFGLSTSGNSKNIIRAIKKARSMGIFTVVLSGKDGGEARMLADMVIIVPSNETARIQESHIMLIHIICGEVEKNLQ